MDENQVYIMGVDDHCAYSEICAHEEFGQACPKETWHNGLYLASSRFAQISEWAAKQA
jgi:hypothetical protein